MDNMNILLIVLLIINQTTAVSYNQPKFCPTVSWNPNATTTADNITGGQEPHKISVDTNNNISITPQTLTLIKLWLNESTRPTSIVLGSFLYSHSAFVAPSDDIYFYRSYNDHNGGDGQNNQHDGHDQNNQHNGDGRNNQHDGHGQNNQYDGHGQNNYNGGRKKRSVGFSRSFNFVNVWSSIHCFVFGCSAHEGQSENINNNMNPTNNNSGSDQTNNSRSNSQNGNFGKVYKWSLNATRVEVVMTVNESCFGLFVDINNTIYCSMRDHHQVVKKSLNTDGSALTIAAGNGSNGSTSETLSYPWGIFVSLDFNLYVADFYNHRIQFFRSGQLNGTTVAEKNAASTDKLFHPSGIVLDADGYLFIVDTGNHRIVVSKSSDFRCLVGCSNASGSALNQLNYPTTLSFDSYGNMFVVDTGNDRIQKFLLATNSCNADTTITTEITTVRTTISKTPSSNFVPPTCVGSTIGPKCNISNTPCDVTQPCQNNGICYNNNTIARGYTCSCPRGFDGVQCQIDRRPCKNDTCWNNGTCIETINQTFSHCVCELGWEGDHCETKVNFCLNNTCQNNGVCHSLFMNYTCECLGDSYSGRHCEITATKIKIYKIVSKSFAYVAIIALIIFAMFIIIMDILKYCFGIDPVHEERQRIRRQKQARKRKPVIQRYVYVNAPPSSAEVSISKVEETVA